MNDSDGFSDARMHGRHNCELRERGTLAITLILPDSPDVVGVGVYTCGADEADALLRDDPAIVAGALTYELQTARSFPGDALP